ncbi:hypothetical protein LCGC14_1093880 [marine sediment metagenome]|uniref:Prenyltransferase alpha-alpha toroid domain-containing protein n=1 Tax=marine sediment metagenome TaxID=412755 RepID=A0A0F9PUR1_9ZZZZ
MKTQKKIIIYVSILVFSFIPMIMGSYPNRLYEKSFNALNKTEENFNNAQNPVLSTHKTNYDIIEEMFGDKLSQYSTLGYFPQVYETSLQATYYALYSLDSIGKLDQINQTKIIDYIISQFDANLGIFKDDYSDRYLNTRSGPHYPLTSVLEVNCYAILSLEILERLDLINIQQSINFIWSCYNPISSGFIGQPFNLNLDSYFKISTMDNTYFALKTLDLLLNNWVSYNQETNELIQYINSLQILNSIDWKLGGFRNDNNNSVNSLIYAEPNLISSYYCIKSLEIFGMISSIDINTFNQFLSSLYNPTEFYFRVSLSGFNSFINIIASAIGIELSALTGFSTINRNSVINFILNNRNHLGIWNQSTTVNTHELIDTFQVLRSLKETGEIIRFTSQEKDQIESSIGLFHQYDGYSLLPKDYTSIEFLFSIINSFHYFGRISDIDILNFYNNIEKIYSEEDFIKEAGFFGNLNFDEYHISFRSFPIEYYGSGNYYISHKFTYFALESLQKIFKLDDFALKVNLLNIVNNILNSQFLDPEYENFGAFLPTQTFTLFPSEVQDSDIYFQYSYYSIKTLVLLANFLNLGDLNTLAFNKGALYGYITRNIFLTNGMLYFNPEDSSNTETILEYNYYMIYILKALNLFDLDLNNITEFIFQNINYENIRNIYYCYKINDILDLGIIFDVNLTSNLVRQLYSEGLHEFYESKNLQVINQEIFLWISEMAMNDDIYIHCSYKDTVKLGGLNTISTAFSNLIFTEYGQLTSVLFESDQLGTLNLEKQFDNTYQISFIIPEDPNFFPTVNGKIMIYDHSKLIGQVPVSFQTNFEQLVDFIPFQNKESTKFTVNVSRKFSSQFQPVYNSTLIVDVLISDTLLETTNFTREDFESYSKFNLNYEYKVPGDYYFKVRLVDNFFPEGLTLFDYNTQSGQMEPDSQVQLKVNGEILAVAGVGITIGLVVFVIKSGRWIKIKIKEGDKSEVMKNKNVKSRKSELTDELKGISFEDFY